MEKLVVKCKSHCKGCGETDYHKCQACYFNQIINESIPEIKR